MNKPPNAGIACDNFLNSDRCLGVYKIKTAEELQTRVDAYFESCDNNKEIRYTAKGQPFEVAAPKPYTWTGLARACGLSGRQALNNYEDRDQFYPILRMARLKVREQWEEGLYRLGNNNGVMFNLTNNISDEDQYVHKTVVDQNIGGQPGNPVELKTDDLSEEQLKRIEAILNANPDTR